MHSATKQLFGSQSVDVEFKGENVLEISLREKRAVKFCRKVSLASRTDRARVAAMIQDALVAVKEGTDPDALARVIRQELFK